MKLYRYDHERRANPPVTFAGMFWIAMIFIGGMAAGWLVFAP